MILLLDKKSEVHIQELDLDITSNGISHIQVQSIKEQLVGRYNNKCIKHGIDIHIKEHNIY